MHIVTNWSFSYSFDTSFRVLNMNNSKIIGYSAAILGGLSFGAVPVLAASLRDMGVSSIEQSFLRLLIGVFAGIGVILIYHYKEAQESLFRTSYFLQKTYIAQGLLLSLMIVSYLSSIAFETPAGEAALLIQIHPFTTLILASLFLEEKITQSKSIALIMALIGLFILTSPWNWDSFLLSLPGDLLALVTGVLYSLYLLIARWSANERSKVSPILSIAWILCWSFLIGLPILVILTLFPLSPSLVSFSVNSLLSPEIIALGILLALFGSIIPYGLIMLASKYIESSKASILLLDEPVGAIILGAILLNEKITLSYIIGGIALLSAIIFLLSTQNHRNN